MRLIKSLAYTVLVLVLGTLALAADLLVGVITQTKAGFIDIGHAIKDCWL